MFVVAYSQAFVLYDSDNVPVYRALVFSSFCDEVVEYHFVFSCIVPPLSFFLSFKVE